MMTKTQKTFFIIATTLCVVALFMLAAGCFLVASIPFYVTGPLRAPRHAARRAALLMLLAEVLVFLLNVGLFIAGYLIA